MAKRKPIAQRDHIDPSHLEELRQILSSLSALEEKMKLGDLTHNYKYRELITFNFLKNTSLLSNLRLSSGKHDCNYGPSLDDCLNLELKSCSGKPIKRNGGRIKPGECEYDKQNDPIRREETLSYDSHCLAVYQSKKFIGCILICDPSAVNLYSKLVLKPKQDQKIREIEQFEALGKRTNRDSIRVKFEEVLDVLTADQVFFVNQHGCIVDIESFCNHIFLDPKIVSNFIERSRVASAA
jgi:hypothetical protein